MVGGDMKKKALRKEFCREICRSGQRFLSIFLISALGASFFAGLRSCKGDMLLSADTFYDETHMMDARIVSTMGLEEADVAAVQALEGIEAAEGVVTHDALVYVAEKTQAVRLYSMTEQVNTYRVIDGRLPQNSTECAVDAEFFKAGGYQLGDTITIVSGDATAITEVLKEATVTITGTVSTGQYMAMSRGSGTIGNGKIAGYLVLYPDNMLSELYTELAVTFTGAAKLNGYSEEYEAISKRQVALLEQLSGERELARLVSVQAEAYEELDTALTEVQEKEAQFYQVLEELISGREEIEAAYAELELAKTELAAAREAAPGAFSEAEAQLEAAYELLEQAYAELEIKAAPVIAARAEYDDYAERLSAISQGPEDIRRILALKGIYEEDIIEAEEGIEAARAELDNRAAELDNQAAELTAQKQELSASLDEKEQLLEESRQELMEQEVELLIAEQDYMDASTETKQAIRDAYADIEAGRAEVAAMEAPEWYVLDRDTIEAYVSMEMDAERMDAIGKVFPFIFFLVAALVSLTTMTRMVDEQRTQIGTLKALGYSKGAIAGKYIKYALYATLSGSLIGVLLGSKIFPYVIITTYKLVYTGLPEVRMPVNWAYSLLATALSVLCTTLAAWSACSRELREQPAALMRPAASKPGKRLLLERVSFIWKHLSFTRKASLRNMFRYKKRFFMTVLGIGACMGLLLVGYGIKDSICVMSEIQYEELWLQDVTVTLNGKQSVQEKISWQEELLQDKEIQAATLLKEASMDFESEQAMKTAVLLVLPEESSADGFYVFRNRESKEKYQLSDEGIILTEKLARMLGVSAGDTMTLRPETASAYTVKVTAVAEHYIGHYGYMTAACYEQLFGEQPSYNECLLKLVHEDLATEEAVAERLLTMEEQVASVSLVSTLQKSIDDMLQSLNVITYVLIVCAGLLAFIVLFNLSNINITERKRELATLKVLGFFDGEVSAYVYRENLLLTLIGIVLGVLIGKVLHSFVMQTVEVDMVMFGRSITAESHVYSILLTIVFACIIGVFMHFKLKKIDMVESLKSIE